jgi:hypothetical protein
LNLETFSSFVFVFSVAMLSAVQLLSFPLHLFAFFPWNASITGWFQWLCAYVTIPGYVDSGASVAAIDLFYVVIALLVVLLTGVGGLAYSLAVHQYAPLWPLQTLRKLMSVLTSVLFMPGLPTASLSDEVVFFLSLLIRLSIESPCLTLFSLSWVCESVVSLFAMVVRDANWSGGEAAHGVLALVFGMLALRLQP